MSKSAEIDEYLKRHYPCAEIPVGDQTKVANIFGVSRELVRQRASKLQIITKTKGSIICPQCNGTKSRISVTCLFCSMANKRIVMNCEVCGGEFRRTIRQQIMATDIGVRGRATQQLICSRVCRALSMQEKMREHRKVHKWDRTSATKEEPKCECGGIKSKHAKRCQKCYIDRVAKLGKALAGQ